MQRFVVAAALVAAGCAASSKAQYGTVVRYEPDNHAWVARNGTKAWWFRDPLTACALQCRDDVVRWSGIAAKESKTINAREGAMGTSMLLTLPLSAPAVVLFLPAWGVDHAVYPSFTAHKDGDAARQRGDLDAAAQSYLLALADGDKAAAEPLAQVWIEQGKLAEAKRARELLLCCGAHLNASDWSRIEDWLRAQGEQIPECADKSKEPIVVHWDD